MPEVFIPSRGRAELLCKTVPAWWALGASVTVVVSEEDESAYTKVVADNYTAWQKLTPWKRTLEILVINRHTQGMGAIRDLCLDVAERRDYEWIIMSDDDIYPHRNSNLEFLGMHVLEHFVLGIGCVVSQHDLLLGDDAWRLKEDVPIFCASGYGFRMFAINIQSAGIVGGFDHDLDVCFEDAEFMRQGVRNGLTWWLDPHLRAVPLGKRFAAGGIADLTGSPEERATRTDACHRRIAELWPGYVSQPGRKAMFAWKRFIDAQMPGWRSAVDWDMWSEWWYAYNGTPDFLRHASELHE